MDSGVLLGKVSELVAMKKEVAEEAEEETPGRRREYRGLVRELIIVVSVRCPLPNETLPSHGLTSAASCPLRSCA